jgi:hypothetical protein
MRKRMSKGRKMRLVRKHKRERQAVRLSRLARARRNGGRR